MRRAPAQKRKIEPDPAQALDLGRVDDSDHLRGGHPGESIEVDDPFDGTLDLRRRHDPDIRQPLLEPGPGAERRLRMQLDWITVGSRVLFEMNIALMVGFHQVF